MKRRSSADGENDYARWSWLPATALSSALTRCIAFAGFFLLLAILPSAADEDKSVSEQPSNPFQANLAELAKIPIPVPTVVGASRWEQPITQAPSSVTIITADDVKKYGYRTLADILQSARGLYVSNDRNYSYLGTRGVNLGDFNNRILLLVDGHRLNNNLTDGAYIGTEGILDVDLIERVEIIRGPGSTLYGNNAFFGVVNVITRLGGSFAGHGAEASVEAGSFDTYKGRVSYGHIFQNGVEMLLSGSWYGSEGQDRLFYKAYTNINSGLTEKTDGDAYKSFFGNLAYRDFTLEGAFSTREKVDPTARYDTAFNDARTRRTDERSYVNLKYTHEFPDIVDVTAQIYFDTWNLIWDQYYNDPPPDQFLREDQYGKWWGAELQLKKRLFDKHTLTVGAEYKDDFQQKRQIADLKTGAILGNTDLDRQSYGVYLQGDFTILTNLHINAGARYDHYGTSGDTANPRVALIYNPLSHSTIKAIYGTAFRAPNFFEIVLIDRSLQHLAPEIIDSYELVYEQDISRHFRSSVSAFFNQIDDRIALVESQQDQQVRTGFRNVGKSEAKGLEFELESFWASGLRGRISYTFQETEDRVTGKILTDSPKHLGKLNLSAPLFKDKLFAGLEFQYGSKRLTLAGTEASGFGVVNFTLFGQNLGKGLDVSASVYNLLDRTYADPSTAFHRQDVLEQDGRSFRVKLTYRF